MTDDVLFLCQGFFQDFTKEGAKSVHLQSRGVGWSKHPPQVLVFMNILCLGGGTVIMHFLVLSVYQMNDSINNIIILWHQTEQYFL